MFMSSLSDCDRMRKPTILTSISTSDGDVESVTCRVVSCGADRCRDSRRRRILFRSTSGCCNHKTRL